jgi:hypothetical protein
MGCLEGSGVPVLYIGRMVPKGKGPGVMCSRPHFKGGGGAHNEGQDRPLFKPAVCSFEHQTA